MLLRVGKRRTSIESDNHAQFVQVEFATSDGSVDRRLSVYQISPDDLVRCRTEHFASAHLGPTAHPNFDVEGLHGRIEDTEGTSRFQFTRTAHRELIFDSDEAVARFAKQLLEEHASRRHSVEKSEMKTYVIARLRTQDTEWMSFCSDVASITHGGIWKKWCAAARSSQ